MVYWYRNQNSKAIDIQRQLTKTRDTNTLVAPSDETKTVHYNIEDFYAYGKTIINNASELFLSNAVSVSSSPIYSHVKSKIITIDGESYTRHLYGYKSTRQFEEGNCFFL